jgi:hypothetical protein
MIPMPAIEFSRHTVRMYRMLAKLLVSAFLYREKCFKILPDAWLLVFLVRYISCFLCLSTAGIGHWSPSFRQSEISRLKGHCGATAGNAATHQRPNS